MAVKHPNINYFKKNLERRYLVQLSVSTVLCRKVKEAGAAHDKYLEITNDYVEN